MQFPAQFEVQPNGCIAMIRNGPVLTGTPTLRFEGQRWYIHRLSYNLNCENIPVRPESTREGIVLHSCDNGWCINHEHLSLGTQKQNIKDMWDRNPNIRDRHRAALLGNENWKKAKWTEQRRQVLREKMLGNRYAEKKHRD